MEIAAGGYLRRFNEADCKAPVINYDAEDEKKKVEGEGKEKEMEITYYQYGKDWGQGYLPLKSQH